MKYIHLYTLFLLFVCCICKGQNQTDLPTDTIHSGNKEVITAYGPSHITRTIKQDRNGNIWIATFGGVFRYDGKSFIHITSKVSSARFFSVLEDRKGNFWFSSVGSGVYYYDGKTFQNFTTKDGLAHDDVTDIYEDKTGNIWFATLSGASRYDGKSFRNYSMNARLPNNDVNFKDHNDVNSIIEDKKGKFWFGTRGHAFVYDGKTFTKVTHKGKPFTNVRTIIKDKKGNIWLGGMDGLWRYDGHIFTNFAQKPVSYVYEDKKGNIWTSSLTTHGWALFRYDENPLSNKNPTVTELELEQEDTKGMLFGILEANDGSIWFGSDGVYRYDGNAITDFKAKWFQK